MNLTWRKAVREARLDTTAKAVAFVLDTYADKNGLCWPGLATISRGAGLSITNNGPAAQAIRRLEAAGLVRVSRSRRASKSVSDRTSTRDSNTYLLTLPTVQQTHSPTVHETHSDGAADAPSTVHLNTSHSAADAHEAGSKPPLNQTKEAVPVTHTNSEPATEPEPACDDEPEPIIDANWFARRAAHVLKDIA